VRITTLIAVMVFLGLVAPLATRAAAQSDHSAKSSGARNERQSRKAIRISGVVGAEGKTLISDKDSRVWAVTNSDSLRSSEGRHVRVKARVEDSTSAINITTVSLTDERPRANLSDAAFRR
jgi:hypothetical protein